MLKKDTLVKMASLLKIDAATFEAAYTDAAEVEIAIPDALHILTADELSARDVATKKTGYSEGSTASIEMFIKDQKKTLGLEFEGKDPNKLIEALSAKVLADAKLEPSAALKEKDSMIAGLRANLATIEAEKATLASTASKIRLDSTILRAIPQNLNGIEPEEVLAAMRLKGFNFEEKDGVVVASKDGVTVADIALKPLPVSDVISGYAKERKWIAENDTDKKGRGAGSSTPRGTTPAKLSEAQKVWENDGKNAGTSDFMRWVDGLAKDNKEFDYNS
jgi:hypothetical protein